MEERSPPSTETECSISLTDITSPSQLQEVTLEHDGTFSNTMGLKSPNGPMRGRSVKEFEEQLTNLKKENFNLKLRIYFLEEKMGSNFTLDKDNIVKKHIELQVDYANLRKEMEEKQELLCQAVKAIELEDEEHKKYIADKEDQLNICQQEIEDLRVQLQDIKYDSEGASTKSDLTGFFSSKTNNSCLIGDLQEKVKILENELYSEKENNASFQLIICQTETLKTRCENMQHELHSKDEIIKNLHQENESINSRIQSYVEQLQDMEEKCDGVLKENQNLSKKLINETKRLEELGGQCQELKKKYGNLKIDLDREHKKSERLKSSYESRFNDLEEENDKLKHKLRENQSKLEAALTEIRKNQNLAVSKSPALKSNGPRTDVASLSVQDAATSPRAPQTDALHVPVVPTATASISISTPKGAVKSTSSTSICLSPDKFGCVDFEEMLMNGAATDKILSVFNTLKNDYDNQRQKLFKLKTEQIKACEIIKNMIESRNKANDEIQQYQLQIKNLEKELESVVSKPTSDGEAPIREQISRVNEKSLLVSKSEEMEEYNEVELYKALSAELEKKIDVLTATLEKKNEHLQQIREQHDELLVRFEETKTKVTELEFELLSTNFSGIKFDKSSLEIGDTASKKRTSFYQNEIEGKDREIERLNSELKKCSCYLQEIVNKELWDKNKEIEKFHRRQVNSPEVLKLRKDLTGKEQQLKLLKDKISEFGLDLNETDFNTLQEELKAAKNKILELEGDLEKSEELRHDSNKVCSLLSSRLEELAVFLDSLLKQKFILGFLGSQKERKLREIINTSLDISKSFNLTLNPDQTLANLSNITTILNGSTLKDPAEEILSIVPGNVTLTYQSHLYKQKDSEEVITALREQIINLKSELQLRDTEISKMAANSRSATEEEGPKVYISPQKTSTTLKYQSDCASESEGWSEPDRTVSRARIGLNQTLNSRLSESTDDDTCLYKKRQEEEYLKQIIDLKKIVEEKSVQLVAADEKLLKMIDTEVHEEVKCNLEEVKCDLKRVTEDLESLVKDKGELNTLLGVKNEEIKKAFDLLEVEKIECQRLYKELEEFKKKEQLFRELENDLKIDLEEKQEKIKKLEESNEESEKKLDELKRVIEFYEETVKVQKSKEEISEMRIAECQDRINTLRKELDATTLEYSESVLEKTRLANEKTILEQELSRYSVKDRELRQQMHEIHSELDAVSRNYQQEITLLQKQKSDLQVKMSVLESNNAELHNRFIKIQASRQQDLSATMPNMKIHQYGYNRQFSDDNFEESTGVNILASSSRNRQRVDAERQEANASPDLGIESDQGRFSSLEMHTINVSRPLLQTIELTESMSNMLDDDNNPLRINNSVNQHYCKRCIELVHENNDLKKKLLRMRRAFEDSANQLNLANQRKKEVEKSICKQIHKTSQVLRKAKANLDSGSEM